MITEKIFREINSLVIFMVKYVDFTKFLSKENFRNLHTEWCTKNYVWKLQNFTLNWKKSDNSILCRTMHALSKMVDMFAFLDF